MTSYIGASPETTIARVRYLYTAVTAQNTFTTATDGQVLSYETTNNVDVFVNGVLLVPTTDYAAETGSSIVLVEAADADDKVEVLTYESYQAANYLPTTGGTITGDLTVDTNTLYVDSTNNRVGVGTTSPSQKLNVSGAGARIYLTGANENISMNSSADGQLHLDGVGWAGAIALNEEGMNIYTNASSRDIIFGVNETERMRILNSGNVGIGTNSPANKLEVSGAIVAQGAATAYTNTGLYLQNKGGSVFDVGAWRSGASVAEISFSTDSGVDASPIERMRIKADGSLQHLSKPAYFARAWVNFKGTGTVSIRDSGNVSSVTDLGTGDYRVNFSTAMADADYSINFGGSPQNGRFLVNWAGTVNNGSTAVVNSTSNCRVAMIDGGSGSRQDSTNNYVSIFR